MKEHYFKIRNHVLHTEQIDQEFTPYMFEYYKVKCEEKGYKILINTINEFNYYLDCFLQIPVTVNTRDNTEMIFNMRNQTISKGIKDTIKYFDEKYK
jgi:hypothetical protein